jgi:hypothetical protein
LGAGAGGGSGGGGTRQEAGASTGGSGVAAAGGRGGGGAASPDAGAGTGGTAGSVAEGGTPKVLPCDALAGAGDQWTDVTPPWQTLGAIPNGSHQAFWGIAVDEGAPGTLYVGTSAYPSYHPSAVWRSTDCGASWTNVSLGKNGDKITQGNPHTITVDPVTSAVYTNSFYGTGQMFKSTTGGTDWDDVTPPGGAGFVNDWMIDPTDHNHIVVTYHADCTAPGSPSSISSCLAETTDGAAHWQIIPGLTSGWGEGFGVLVVGGGTWLASAYPNMYLTTNGGRYTTDPSQAWQPVLGNGGAYTHSTNFAEVGGTYYIGGGNSVQKSTDLKTWSALPGAPSACDLIATGKYLFAGRCFDTTGQPVWRAPLSDLTKWEQVTALTATGGSGQTDDGPFAYDSSHKVLYVVVQPSGIWRTVTE